ncbi:Uncharacterised protein [uncultured archaeon]|nr:Uncharacterised protein [uncultured archaeon]
MNFKRIIVVFELNYSFKQQVHQVLMISLDEIPVINWPDKSGEFKFVQLEVLNNLFLRFEVKRPDFHIYILRDFLTELNLPIIKTRSESGTRIIEPKGENYLVSGMGIADVYLEEKRIDFLGKSMDYKLAVNNDHIDKINLLFPDWKFRHL